MVKYKIMQKFLRKSGKFLVVYTFLSGTVLLGGLMYMVYNEYQEYRSSGKDTVEAVLGAQTEQQTGLRQTCYTFEPAAVAADESFTIQWDSYQNTEQQLLTVVIPEKYRSCVPLMVGKVTFTIPGDDTKTTLGMWQVAQGLQVLLPPGVDAETTGEVQLYLSSSETKTVNETFSQPKHLIEWWRTAW